MDGDKGEEDVEEHIEGVGVSVVGVKEGSDGDDATRRRIKRIDP